MSFASILAGSISQQGRYAFQFLERQKIHRWHQKKPFETLKRILSIISIRDLKTMNCLLQ